MAVTFHFVKETVFNHTKPFNRRLAALLYFSRVKRR
nr:MAG TPA: hypothetical protein [Caudoviricetes sp.]